ncbi:MAG: ATP-binding cassette domain-containing protein [Deltaproteobacteria bacterium]|jgi:lincosamide and streptogramin A transport system ATP-binding/permease protein|nr:ATP-binding cassette domain-containing protein [Deltaproteobacteria bacterium]
MPFIIIKDLTFGYDGSPHLFEGLNLNLDSSFKLGLIGRNGCGKTTFLKLLSGQLNYVGKIDTSERFLYFPPAVENPHLNAYELSLSLRPESHRDYRLEREASLLALNKTALERPFDTLSGGEATKVLLSILFLEENVFPLIDEPTQNLDLRGREVVKDYLSLKKGFILASHERLLLDSCVDHILALSLTGIELVKGNFSSYMENRIRWEEFQKNEKTKLNSEIARLERASQKSRQWAQKTEKGKYGEGPVDRGYIGHKAAKMNKRAKAVDKRRQEALEEKKALVIKNEKRVNLSLEPLKYHHEVLAYGKDLSVGYQETPNLTDLSFSIRRGEILAVKGPNGSGKSLFLKLLLGEAKIFSGEYHRAENLIISYVPQKMEVENISLRELSQTRLVDEAQLKTILRHLGLDRKDFEVRLSDMSLGQKKKIFLALSLATPAHLYLWDEPMGYVDILSRLEIEELLVAKRPTMVVIEHDLVLLKHVATDTLDLTRHLHNRNELNEMSE